MGLLQEHRVIWSLGTNDRLTGSQNDHWMEGGGGGEAEERVESGGADSRETADRCRAAGALADSSLKMVAVIMSGHIRKMTLWRRIAEEEPQSPGSCCSHS